MRRSLRLSLAATAAAASLIVAASLQAAPAITTLNGTVGPGFVITLTKGGKKVTSLKAGKYKLVVKDLSSAHNFHLTGPGVNKSTGISKTGTTTWTLTFKKGTYRFVCDPHSTSMKGSFKAT